MRMSIDEFGIGYVSLSSVNSTVKGLYFNGVAPTEANVINNTYGLKRPVHVDGPSSRRLSVTRPSKTIVNAFIAFLGTARRRRHHQQRPRHRSSLDDYLGFDQSQPHRLQSRQQRRGHRTLRRIRFDSKSRRSD
ncbi:MAG: hypothetical protein MZU97_21480 [Bacillus subtilis]|nr:hypothetical protein [Bacillus subtilis]